MFFNPPIYQHKQKQRLVASLDVSLYGKCQYMGRYGNSNMGTKKNNHTDPICFRCFESDFRWYFQLTFLKIKTLTK